MIPKEILKQIRRIQITTSRMVTDVFAGQYRSVFKGRGMEFDEVREYVPGDEIRTIDWNVTARFGHPYVKKFVEERELTVMIILDLSFSSNYGTVKRLKSELAAEIAAVLGFSAIKSNDKIGLIIFTDRIEKFIPPRKGSRHVLRLIREMLYYKPQGKGTDIALALDYLSKVTKRKTISFLISDFLDTGFKKSLSIANKRHDIISVVINDPSEYFLKNVGIVRFSDAENGDEFYVDTSDENFRQQYYNNASTRTMELSKIFSSVNVDSIKIETDKPYIHELVRFFKKRERRQR